MTDINTVDKITSEVDLLGSILQQTVLLNEFVREFAPLASLQQREQAGQQNYKAVIQFALFIVYTKQLTSEAELAHRKLFRQKVMRFPYRCVQFKHLSIPQNLTNYNFDNVFTGSLPDLVVVGLFDDVDFAGGYQRNPFNFQTLA